MMALKTFLEPRHIVIASNALEEYFEYFAKNHLETKPNNKSNMPPSMLKNEVSNSGTSQIRHEKSTVSKCGYDVSYQHECFFSYHG